MCTLPQFFDFLSDEDKSKYLYMRNTFSSSVCKNRRNNSSQTFEQILNTINKYAIRSDSDDWKRCIVCGIFWLDDIQIAVNSKQLCTLLAKCKSSINGSLILLHYVKVENNLDQVKSFMNTIPLLQLKPALIEHRQWTIRKKISNINEDKVEDMKDSLRNSEFKEQKQENYTVFGINDKTYYCDDKIYNEYLLSEDEFNDVFDEIHKGNEQCNKTSRNNDQYAFQMNSASNSNITHKDLNLNSVHMNVDLFHIPEEDANLDSDFVDCSDYYFYQ